MTQSNLGPEVLATAAEKQGLHSKYTDQAAHATEKMGVKVRVPNLKDLVTKPGAVAGMLRAIMNFLKLRFPAFLGMNVLYSLGLFSKSSICRLHTHYGKSHLILNVSAVLLFVFWYCHKRGREIRLEKERLLTEAELEALNKVTSGDDPLLALTVPSNDPPDEPSNAEFTPGSSLTTD